MWVHLHGIIVELSAKDAEDTATMVSLGPALGVEVDSVDADVNELNADSETVGVVGIVGGLAKGEDMVIVALLGPASGEEVEAIDMNISTLDAEVVGMVV